MPSRPINVINALYGDELRRSRFSVLQWLFPRSIRFRMDAKRREKRILALYGERERTLTRGRIVICVIVIFLASLFLTNVYYYNSLTRWEQDVYKEKAKIDSLLQRRRNISINLARTVRDYAVHEQRIFHHVSNTRGALVDNPGSSAPPGDTPDGSLPLPSDAPAAAPPADTAELPVAPMGTNSGGMLENIIAMLDGSDGGGIPIDQKLASLMAVAESYPDLKLSGNFQRFMDALVETEKELSDRRMTYTDVANSYTTRLKTLPGKLFALIYGFEPFPYFVADSDAQKFKPVEY